MKKIKFIIVVFYLALFDGLAFYDEKPDPELMREMTHPLPEAIEPGNAWLIFLGFTAREGLSPYARGKEIMRKSRELAASGKNFADFYSSVDDDKSALTFRGNLPSFRNEKGGGMLSYATAHPGAIPILCRDNSTLLRRYEAVLACSRFSEPIDFGYFTPMPGFGPLRNAQKLRLLKLADAAAKGDLTSALEGLHADMEFWRMVSRNSRTLISRLIAIICLNTDIRFAAELGASRHLTTTELKMVQDILRPFTRGENTFSGAFRGEARYMQRGMELTTWRTMKKWSPEKLVFKPVATRNRMFADCLEFIRLSELPSRQYASEMKRREKNRDGVRRIGIPFLYNSTGEIVAMIGIPALNGYIEKGHNLEGLRRLALLKVLSWQENIPPERMTQYMDAHADDLGNPFSDGPMHWNDKKGTIFFNELSGEKPVEIYMK